MSDFFMNAEIAGAGLTELAADFNPRLCATDPASIGVNGPELCQAYADGLRHSMAATACFMALAALCYFMAARYFGRDRYNPAVPHAGMHTA